MFKEVPSWLTHDAPGETIPIQWQWAHDFVQGYLTSQWQLVHDIVQGYREQNVILSTQCHKNGKGRIGSLNMGAQ